MINIFQNGWNAFSKCPFTSQNTVSANFPYTGGKRPWSECAPLNRVLRFGRSDSCNGLTLEQSWWGSRKCQIEQCVYMYVCVCVGGGRGQGLTPKPLNALTSTPSPTVFHMKRLLVLIFLRNGHLCCNTFFVSVSRYLSQSKCTQQVSPGWKQRNYETLKKIAQNSCGHKCNVTVEVPLRSTRWHTET